MSFQKKLKLIPIASGCERVRGVFWKHSNSFVDELSEYLKGKKVLEVFSGNGFLAGLLSAKGIEVTATSILSGMDAHESGIYHQVIELDANKAVMEFGKENDILLMCWPTVTVQAFQSAMLWSSIKQGAPIVFIGEVTDYSIWQLGGCATDAFHERFIPNHVFKSYRGNGYEKALAGTMEVN